MTEQSSVSPALSVVLVTDHYETIRLVVACFAAQTNPETIEVVIVIPGDCVNEVPVERLEMFHAVRIVAVDSIKPMPAARAAGVRATTAPIIFIGETHSFPHPGFAEAIVAAHEGPWDVVVPGLANANPSSPKSWAAFILDYGYWLSALSPSTIVNGPTWNASYKRHVLTDLGPQLDTALSSGDELPQKLRSENRRVYFEPRAVIDHTNVETHGWADERFLSGLVVGANRGRRWSKPRRAFYFAASPLIPFVLFYRLSKAVRVLLRDDSLPRGSLLAIAGAAVVRTVGEAAGYVVGIDSKAEDRMEHYELHKLQFATHLAGAVEAIA